MKQRSTLLAKITSPHYERILPRERLFHLLDGYSKRLIIWISAPAGSGKTALVTSYLKERKPPHLWYRLDARDNDSAAFFHYFSLAAKKAVPRKRKPLPLLAPENLPDLSTFTMRYFEELYGRLKPSTFLVIDNYQDVPFDSTFHEIIRDGLSLIPDGITVILISRHAPPPALARFRANNTMALLGWHELKLTEEEALAVVRLQGKIYHKNRQDKMIKHLHETTQGWVAGLILLLEQATTGNMKTDTFTETSHRIIFNYFTNEVLLKMDKETQGFLYKTAFLPTILARTAEQLTRNPKANQILSTLTAENCFTCKHAGGSQVYEYHPLFREYLLSRAEEVLKKEDLAQVQCDAAKALEAAGQPEEAVELFCKAGNWDEMTRLVLLLAPALISQGRYRTLETWINKLPKSIMDQTVWPQYWSGSCHLPFDTAKARRHFESAFKQFEAQEDQTGTLFSWCGIVDAVIYQWDDLTILDHWIEWLDEYVKIYRSFPSPELEARVACSMSNALMYRQMDRPDVSKWFDRAWSLARKNGDNNLLMHVGFSLMYYYLWLGHHIKARILLEKLQALPSSDQPSPLAMIMLKIMESHTQLWSGSYDVGLCALHEGIKIAKASGVYIKDPLLYAQGPYFFLSRGDAPEAREYLGKMASALNAGRNCLDESHYHYLMGWESMLRNDYACALEHVESAVKICIDAGAPFPEALGRLGLAQVLFEQGDYKKAELHLNRSLLYARKTKSVALEYHAALIAAYFAFEQGNVSEGHNSLGQAMALGKSNAYIHYTAWWRPDMMTRLCIRSLEAGIETAYVQEMIRQRNLVPDQPPVECEEWPWTLKIYTLGRFVVLKDGVPIRFNGKAQHKLMDFLKALIAFGGREVGEHRLVEALWPNAEGDTAHWSFATTLKRLRKLLAYKDSLILKDGRLSLNARYCWVDIWAFGRLLGQVEDLLQKQGPDQQSTAQIKGVTQKAMALYQGAFLKNESSQPWGLSRQENIHNRYKSLLEAIGLYWEVAGDHLAAIACYRKGVEVDNLSELFYQRLMACFKQLNLRTEAVSVYHLCKDALQSGLNINPSQETETIFKSLHTEETEKDR